MNPSIVTFCCVVFYDEKNKRISLLQSVVSFTCIFSIVSSNMDSVENVERKNIENENVERRKRKLPYIGIFFFFFRRFPFRYFSFRYFSPIPSKCA